MTIIQVNKNSSGNLPVLEFVILSLATWRITSMLFREHFFDWFRKLFGVLHDERGPVAYPTWMSQAFECFWCLSLIVALPLSFVMGALMAGVWPRLWWILWLALSAAAIWLETRTGHFNVRS